MAKKKLPAMNTFIYDCLLWIVSLVIDLFFREVHPRSAWKIPRTGPVLFVAAPHANQFIDPLILSRIVRNEGHRRIQFLIAEKSTKRAFVGAVAGAMGALPVGRALDSTKPAEGKVYLPDPKGDPTLLRGVGTHFDSPQFQIGGLIVLPSVNNVAANCEIAEIHGPQELRLKRPFKGQVAIQQLTGREDVNEDGKLVNGSRDTANGCADGFEGTSFKVAPKVDQSAVYEAVFARLHDGGCVGIFPEGGSHDRTELLPLKAGVAIMALETLAKQPDCPVKIVPCGMNYFHAHKFRSRAVVEFGTPVEVPDELVDLYRKGERREAIGRLLEMVYQALVSVTVLTPDYDTLMLIQAVRRLYNPKGKKLPLPVVVELNRRLVRGYQRYKDDPRIAHLRKSVIAYNKQLLSLNVRDHQVEYGKLPFYKVFGMLIYRVTKLLLLSIGVLPGAILFSPVFIVGKTYSIKKSREALAASTVKIQARDVLATWKLLVSLALAPTLYTLYTCLLTWWTYRNRVQGYVPEYVPLWAVMLFGYILFPTITYAALRFGEVGMDIVKSLRPLVVALDPTSGNRLAKLRSTRAALAHDVTEVINTLGPEMFPDFDSARIVADPFREGSAQDASEQRRHFRNDSETFSLDSVPSSPTGANAESNFGGLTSAQGSLPRNESFRNLGGIGLFASRPATPKQSRSRKNSAGGFPLQGFSTLDSKEGMDQVSKKIRETMRERGQRRRSGGADGWEMASGATTPRSSDGPGSRPGTAGSERGKKDV